MVRGVLFPIAPAAVIVSVVVLAAACLPPSSARAPKATAAVPDDLSRMLTEGAAVPDVAGLGMDEKPWPLSKFKGRPLVLYFYPMDFATGASAQATEFREDHARYRKLGVTVVGVSTDPPQSHRDFKDRHKLPYPLLSDVDGQLARAFGVPLQAGTTRHATFLIDRKGIVRKVWPTVHPWGHSREVLSALRSLDR